MNIKNNGRKKKSVEKIEKAYIELLQKNERKDITISLISEKAGINRSTFYANFIDINDLKEHIKGRLLAEFREVYKDEVKMRKGSNDFFKAVLSYKGKQDALSHIF